MSVPAKMLYTRSYGKFSELREKSGKMKVVKSGHPVSGYIFCLYSEHEKVFLNSVTRSLERIEVLHWLSADFSVERKLYTFNLLCVLHIFLSILNALKLVEGRMLFSIKLQ